MTSIANGEDGLSVRTKLNAALAVTDAVSFATRADFVSANTANPGIGLSDGQIAVAGGYEYRRLSASTAIADLAGWVPNDPVSFLHFPQTAPGLAAGVTEAANTTLHLQGDLGVSLPSDFSGTLLEYDEASALRWFHTRSDVGTAKRAFYAQHPAHASEAMATLSIDTDARGSTANGPSTADYALSLNIAKKGFATGGAVGGEINGLTINVRQDGPQGLPSSDPGSSDACGILINAQTVGTAGFVAASETVTTQIDPSTFATLRGVRTQAGAITSNASPSPLSYGFSVVSDAGSNNYAFYAGQTGSGSWQNLFFAQDKMRIDGGGNYFVTTSDWPSGAWQLSRAAGAAGALTLFNAGIGGIILTAGGLGEIKFATNSTVRWGVNSAGGFVPETGLSVNIGDPSKLILGVYARDLELGTGGVVRVNSTQVLTARRTGWTAPTGTATRSTFDTATVTTAQLAERVKGLIDDLTTHGLIGA